jgi:hypothetical protein
MKRLRLLLPFLPLAVLSGCLAQPSDEEQIRSVARRIVSAVNREDWGAAYRQTDLDYRATCSLHQLTETQRPRWGEDRPLRLEGVDDLSIQHIRASAMLAVSGASGTRRVPQQFIRDGGRWYLYVPEC